jgi:hypothetical protein
VIDSFQSGPRKRAYWGIRTDTADCHLADPLPCRHDRTPAQVETPTRLMRLDDQVQEQLTN